MANVRLIGPRSSRENYFILGNKFPVTYDQKVVACVRVALIPTREN